MQREWLDKIFSVTAAGFEQRALEIFQYQYRENPVYHAYADAIGVNAGSVDAIAKIPFLPVNFFKTHEVKSGLFEPEKIFESSGTTQTINSKHFVESTALYSESFTRGFEIFYGYPTQWCINGLLPSYLERKNSSLVFMVNELIRLSGHPHSGFYQDDYQKLASTLESLEKKKQKTLLLGVTFALLDFAEKFPMDLKFTTVMETGGMKGRRQEMTRMEVHEILKRAFRRNEIHSEYGMTELLSQAYSKKDGIFHCPPWMKVMIRDEEDPFLVYSRESIVNSEELPRDSRLASQSGAINIIDLANVNSCSFIATDDVGKLNADGSFEVLGRMDGSDLRGCSLMVV
jgi:hypothetical protein